MPLSRPALENRAQRVKLIAMDVDGVLTNGDIIVLESGEEIKVWNSKDRLLLALLRDTNVSLKFAWITGRSSPAVTRTARELGIHFVVQKCKDKKKALMTILKKENLQLEDAAFIGDDLIDLSAIRSVGFGACPSDGVPDVKTTAHYISPIKGGKGVVRDVLEFILQAQNKWDQLLKPFLA